MWSRSTFESRSPVAKIKRTWSIPTSFIKKGCCFAIATKKPRASECTAAKAFLVNWSYLAPGAPRQGAKLSPPIMDMCTFCIGEILSFLESHTCAEDTLAQKSAWRQVQFAGEPLEKNICSILWYRWNITGLRARKHGRPLLCAIKVRR